MKFFNYKNTFVAVRRDGSFVEVVHGLNYQSIHIGYSADLPNSATDGVEITKQSFYDRLRHSLGRLDEELEKM